MRTKNGWRNWPSGVNCMQLTSMTCPTKRSALASAHRISRSVSEKPAAHGALGGGDVAEPAEMFAVAFDESSDGDVARFGRFDLEPAIALTKD